MTQTHKLGTRYTTLARLGDGTIRVTYHSTDVVTVRPNGDIVLDTGGWFTATTKVRMNQAANQLGLPYQVYQSDHSWFVTFAGKDHPFRGKDHNYSITLRKTGSVVRA